MDDELAPWLNGEEERAWLGLIGVILQLPGALDAQLQRDSGLTFYEYGVLAGLALTGNDGGLRMSELATVTSGQLPRLSQVITRMEKREWVERRPDPDDGRATRVVMLPGGSELLEAAAPGHVRRVRELIFDHLSDTQVRQLGGIGLSLSLALGPSPLLDNGNANPPAD